MNSEQLIVTVVTNECERNGMCFYCRILVRLTHFAVSGSMERHTITFDTIFCENLPQILSPNHGFRASNLACVLSPTPPTVLRKEF